MTRRLRTEKLTRMWVIAGILIAIAAQTRGADTVASLEKDFWEWRMDDSPTYSTYMGYYAYNDRLGSYNMSMFDSRKDSMEKFLQRLEAVDSPKETAKQKADYNILHDTVKTFLDGYEWRMQAALNPVNFLGGIQIYYSAIMASSTSRGDFENYIVRLHLLSKQIDEIIETMTEAIHTGFQYNNVSIETVPGQLDQILQHNATTSYFYTCCFADKLDKADSIADSDRMDIRVRGEAAVTEALSAYQKLKDFIVNEYLPNTRTAIAVGSLKNGMEFYKACLKWHLSYEMEPDDVHTTGLEEVNRIHANMKAIMKKLNFDGTVKEFFHSLQNDSRFTIDNGDDIVKAYEQMITERINPVLPNYFKNIPDIPLEVRKMSYDGPGGGYSSATETSPGVFSVNVMRPKENPTFDFMALALHEASPGHHLQHIYGMRANLPDFRKQAELSFYNPPFYFPFYSAYTEGWALYSEYLGEEMNLYKDDYELMGRYSAEMLRSCRLVVDTGMHSKGWTRDHAIEYMLNYTAYSREAVEIEINRYITWPGQACAYKLGEIQIKNLRKRAETTLGSRFDIKDFHSVILDNGPMPMSVLTDTIDNWIQTVQSTPVPLPTSGVTATVFQKEYTLYIYCLLSACISLLISKPLVSS